MSAGRVPDRLVEISATDSAGGTPGYGSGWVVTDDLVLTAAHLLGTPDERRVTVEVRQGMHAAWRCWHPCEVQWMDRTLDVALLVVKGAGWCPPESEEPDLSWESPDIDRFQIFGFPRFRYSAEHAHDLFQGGGRLRPANLGRSQVMSVDLDADDCPETPDGWPGISGAAVLSGSRRSLVGVVLGNDLGDRRRLRIQPVDGITAHPGFASAWRAHQEHQIEARLEHSTLVAILKALEKQEALDGAHGARGRRRLAERLVPQASVDTLLRRAEHPLAPLVDHCAGQPAGLDELAAAFAHVVPHDRVTFAELCCRADEFEAVRVLGAEIWGGLRDALSRLLTSDLNGLPVSALYARAVGPGAPEMPVHCDKLWKAFVNLVGMNTPSVGLPPGMRFLEHVASAVGGRPAGQIRALNRAWALGMEIARANDRVRAANGGPSYPFQVDALRSSLMSAPVLPAVSARLLVELDPEPGSDAALWAVSFYCLPSPGDWRQLRLPHAERRILTSELPTCMEHAKSRLVADTGVDRARIDVEYVLPLALINHPDALMQLGGLSSYSGILFPIVVHSRDRLRYDLWRESWHERWRPLSRQPEAGELLQSPGERGDLRDEIRSNERIAGLVLSRKPDGGPGLEEMVEALRHGVPIVMWRHHEDSEPDFGGLFRRMMAEGTLDCRRLREEDVGSRRSDGSDPEVHRRIVMIFDLPGHLPELIYGGVG